MTQEQQTKWESAMNALMARRAAGGFSNQRPTPAGDYAGHISKVFIGKSVLDIGCGSQALRKIIPSNVEYVGLDPFPITPDTLKGIAEELPLNAKVIYDTVIAFAVLDGCIDLKKALQGMSANASKNIVILTGIGIEPDQYHTHKIELQDIFDALPEFQPQMIYWPEEKVCLLDMHRFVWK